MGFTAGRESSDTNLNRVAPTCRSVLRKNGNPWYPSFRNGLVGLRCQEMRQGHKPRKKVTTVFYESEEDGSVKQSETESLIDERWSDQNESMWLSLKCVSPSFLISADQRLHDVWDYDWWDLSLGNQFFSMLSLFGGSGVLSERGISLFDGSTINPIEEAALVLDTTLGNTEKVCEEDLQVGVINWLHNSLGDDTKDTPITSSESADSAYERSFCEDSSVFESSLTSLITHEDSSDSQVSDFDRTGIWVSLLDLEGEDFEWVSDKKQGFDAFQSDFPSPSFHIKRNFDIEYSDSSVTSPSDEKSNSDLLSEPVLESKNQFICSTCESDLEGLNSDEPLFWPFERNSYWCPEIEWDRLCASPCNNSIKISNSERFFSPSSIKLRLHERKVKPIQRDVPEGYTRKIVFRSKSTISTVLGSKTRVGNDGVRGINRCPSRLGSCTQGSFGLHSCNISTKKRPLKVKENFPLINYGKGQSFHLQRQLQCPDELQFQGENNQNSKNRIKKSIMIKHYDLKELNQSQFQIPGEDYFLIEGLKANEEVPIETLVGLNEFNGHEGIDVEFDESKFFLDGLLSEDPFTVSLSDGSCSIEGDGHDIVSCTTTFEFSD